MKVDIGLGSGSAFELQVSKQEYKLLRDMVESKLRRINKSDAITEEGMRQKALLALMQMAFMDARERLGF